MKRLIAALLLLGAILHFAPSLATAVVIIDTVPVGDPGNPAQSVDPPELFFSPPGAVAYSYQIGKFEVTNSQYVEFLNAKAATDTLELYNPAMASDPRGGITQAGVSGSLTYSVKPNMGNKPVNHVNFFGAIRFVNWLNNGQGSGGTESGAYTLLGGTPLPSNDAIERNAGATWYLPSQDEWWKAGHYDPRLEAQGGPPGDDHYWSYATQNDVAPILAIADSAGNIINPAANVANYNNGADWNGQDGNVTTVGSAGPLSTSYYGTFDQAANIAELTDTIWATTLGDPPSALRLILGGSWAEPLAATSHNVGDLSEDAMVGFRVVMIPEPGSIVLAVVGVVLAPRLLRLRRRRAESAS